MFITIINPKKNQLLVYYSKNKIRLILKISDYQEIQPQKFVWLEGYCYCYYYFFCFILFLSTIQRHIDSQVIQSNTLILY